MDMQRRRNDTTELGGMTVRRAVWYFMTVPWGARRWGPRRLLLGMEMVLAKRMVWSG